MFTRAKCQQCLQPELQFSRSTFESEGAALRIAFFSCRAKTCRSCRSTLRLLQARTKYFNLSTLSFLRGCRAICFDCCGETSLGLRRHRCFQLIKLFGATKCWFSTFPVAIGSSGRGEEADDVKGSGGATKHFLSGPSGHCI